MRFVPLALMSLALVTACGESSGARPMATKTQTLITATSTPSELSLGTPVDGPRVLAMDLLSEDQGWVLTEERLAWTNDRGRTWSDIAPTEARVNRGSVFFLDRRHGWLVTVVPSERGFEAPSTVTVYWTSDGGATWQQASFDGPPLNKDVRPPLFGAAPQFVDEEHGWLVQISRGGNLTGLSLRRTSDGGQTWSPVDGTFTGFADHAVQFIDPSNGWLAFEEPLRVTRDGGVTWQPESLPLRNGCETRGAQYDTPKFLDRERAVLSVRQECNGEHGTVFYVTEDGGSAWEIAAIRPGANDSYVLTPSKWIDVRPDSVFVSTDSGVHWDDVTNDWSSIRSTLGASEVGFSNFLYDFASASAGWAQSPGRGLVAATSDGGRTWELIYP